MKNLKSSAEANGHINNYWIQNSDNYDDDLITAEAFVEAEEKGGKGSGHYGHAGRPGLVGGSAPAGAGGGAIGENSQDYGSVRVVKEFPKELALIANSIAKPAFRKDIDDLGTLREWAGLENEYGIFLGNSFSFDVGGNASFIDIPKEKVIFLIQQQGVWFCHNHPEITKGDQDSAFLSAPDIAFAVSYGIEQFSAINKKGWCTLYTTKNSISKTEIWNAIDRADGLFYFSEEYSKLQKNIKDVLFRYKSSREKDHNINLAKAIIRAKYIESQFPGKIRFEIGRWDNSEIDPVTKMALEFSLETFKGGKGSGHYGHAGRPGLVGGSAPAGAGGGAIGDLTLRTVLPNNLKEKTISIENFSNFDIRSDADKKILTTSEYLHAWSINGRERGCFVTSSGNEVLSKTGTSSEIHYENQEMGLILRSSLHEEISFLHNHPVPKEDIKKYPDIEELPTLSYTDILFSLQLNVKSISAFNQFGYSKVTLKKDVVVDTATIKKMVEAYEVFYNRMATKARSSPEVHFGGKLRQKLSRAVDFSVMAYFAKAYPQYFDFEYGWWTGERQDYMALVEDYFDDWFMQPRVKGGKGSGHYGHAGRPGLVGGSAPAGAGGGKISDYVAKKTDQNGVEYTDNEIIDYLRKESYYRERYDYFINLIEFLGNEVDKAKAWGKVEFTINQNGEKKEVSLNEAQVRELADYTKNLFEERKAEIKRRFGLPTTVEEFNKAVGFDIETTDFRKMTDEQEESYRQFVQSVTNKIMYEDLGDIGVKDIREFYYDIGDDLKAKYGGEGYNLDRPSEYYKAYEHLNHFEGRIKDAAEFNVDHQLSLGKITPEEAKRRGAGDSQGGEWGLMPEVMYHVTTNARAVLGDRLRSRRELGGMSAEVGLGGGADHTISFTTEFGTAQMIERALHEAHMVATGEFSFYEMIAMARQGGGGVGRPWLRDLIEFKFGKNSIPQNFNEKDEDTYPEIVKELMEKSFTHRKDPKFIESIWDIWHIYYVAARKLAGGFDDPLFFGTNIEGLAKIDPSEIKILKVTPKPGAMGYKVSALGEIRTVGGDTISIEEVLNEIDPSDFRKIIG